MASVASSTPPLFVSGLSNLELTNLVDVEEAFASFEVVIAGMVQTMNELDKSNAALQARYDVLSFWYEEQCKELESLRVKVNRYNFHQEAVRR